MHSHLYDVLCKIQDLFIQPECIIERIGTVQQDTLKSVFNHLDNSIDFSLRLVSNSLGSSNSLILCGILDTVLGKLLESILYFLLTRT